MKIYLFIYNVVSIKINLSELPFNKNDRFVLIASDYAIEKLSESNKDFFHEVYRIERNFHKLDQSQLEHIISKYLRYYLPQDIVICSNEDSTQLACARIREKYQIPGPSVPQVEPFVNKDISKRNLEGKVSIPEFILFNKTQYRKNPDHCLQHIINTIGFPMFIKPIDLVSSIGTYAVFDEPTLKNVLKTINQQPWDFEIDEYIDGELYHCDLVVNKQEVHFFMAGHYANPLAKFAKGSPMGSIVVVDEVLVVRLKEFSLTVLKNLGTFSSAFHIEIFREKRTDRLVFLEAAARTPGALVPEMYEIVCNVHLEKMHYLSQMNAELTAVQNSSSYYAGWITFPKVEGYIEELKTPKLSIQHQLMSFVNQGDHLSQAQSLLDSAFSVVFWDKSPSEIQKAFNHLKTHKLLRTSFDIECPK